MRLELIKFIAAFCIAGAIVFFVHRFVVRPRHFHSDNEGQARQPVPLKQPKNKFVRTIADIHDMLEDDVTARTIRWVRTEVSAHFQSIAYFDANLGKQRFFLTGNANVLLSQQLYCWLYFADAESDVAYFEVRQLRSTVVEQEEVNKNHVTVNAVGVCDKLEFTEPLVLDTNDEAKQLEHEEPIQQAKHRKVIGLVSTYRKQVGDHLKKLRENLDSLNMAIVLNRAENTGLSANTPIGQWSMLLCTDHMLTAVDPRALVEWIEYSKLFGADLLVIAAHESLDQQVFNILRYYEQGGLVQLWIVRDTFSQHGSARSNRILGHSLNNCLEFNRYQYQFAVAYGLRQIWVPLQDQSYDSLLQRLAKQLGDRHFVVNKQVFIEEDHYEDHDKPFTHRLLHRLQTSYGAGLSVVPISHCQVLGSLKCLVLYANIVYRPHNVSVDVTSLFDYSHCFVSNSLRAMKTSSKPFTHSDCKVSLHLESLVLDTTMTRFSSLSALINDTMSVFDPNVIS